MDHAIEVCLGNFGVRASDNRGPLRVLGRDIGMVRVILIVRLITLTSNQD